jgi:uncharacterized membrane protein YedE/YeeE
LGASGAIKSVVVASVGGAAPAHAESSPFYGPYLEGVTRGPLKSWLVFEVAGALLGAFVSGLVSDRLKLVTESGPAIGRGLRWSFALLGGGLFGAGAQIARGCTSGAALSGMAVLSTAGFVTMLAIFGTGYAGAYFVRRLWLHKKG